MKRILDSIALLTAVEEATLSEAKLVEDYGNAVIDVILTGFTGTIKVKVSNQALPPDFSAASTPVNHWTYMDLVGRDDGGATITGTTGIVETTTTSNTSFAVNADAIRWIAADVEARSAGSASVMLSGSTND